MNQRMLQLVLLLFLCMPAMSRQQPGRGSSRPAVADNNSPNTKTDHHQMSTKDVTERLKKDLDSKNKAYAGSNIRAVVDDQSVTLNGSVTSESQHEMAMQVAKAYAGDRKITDHLVIRE